MIFCPSLAGGALSDQSWKYEKRPLQSRYYVEEGLPLLVMSRGKYK